MGRVTQPGRGTGVPAPVSTVNLSPECPECGSARSLVRGASFDEQGHRIRARRCVVCETNFTTLEVAIPFRFSATDSLKRERHNTKGPMKKATDSFVLIPSRAEDTWILQLRRGRKSDLCGRGLHELSGDNVYVNKRTGHRVCKPCRRENSKERYANRMAKMPESIREDVREQWRADNEKRAEYRREWARRKRQERAA